MADESTTYNPENHQLRTHYYAGIPIYTNPGLRDGVVELRDNQGRLLARVENVALVEVAGR